MRRCTTIMELKSDPIIASHHKGFPPYAVGRRVSQLHGSVSLTDGDFTTPVLLLHRDALHANVSAMRRYCASAGVSLSPHAKTAMSPEIIDLQRTAGTWGMTVANYTQAAVLRQMGVERLVIANEVVDPHAIAWLGAALDDDQAFTGYCYVDSIADIDCMEEMLRAREQRRRVPVFVEYGPISGRGGVRSVSDALWLARHIRHTDHLVLAGVAGFEGIVGHGFERDRIEDVLSYLRDLREVADTLFEHWQHHSDEYIVTAGGSCFFELACEVLGREWIGVRPIRTVLRSGCYATHDSSALEECRSLVAEHCAVLRLTPALELWARVLSRPESDLAILDFGRRDTGTDAGLPVPRHWLRRGTKAIEPAPPTRIIELNDQHAYLKPTTHAAGSVLPLEVGDLVGLGISHPCTTLDKWRLMPMVDSDRRLVGAIQTMF